MKKPKVYNLLDDITYDMQSSLLLPLFVFIVNRINPTVMRFDTQKNLALVAKLVGWMI